MHFVDPACGSGSFLIGAFQFLLDYHLDYYTVNEQELTKAEKNDLIYKDSISHKYKLSVEEKKRILLNNIYGVDIDAQAVEVTKLSLFLKLLEEEGRELSETGQYYAFKKTELSKKILPNMSANVCCGNSLVGTDFYSKQESFEFNDDFVRKLNAFDWKNTFKNVFENDGFDCVIGNPPYVKEYTNRQIFEPLHDDPCYQGKMDFWYFFGSRALEITKNNGLIGFIAPNNWVTNKGAGRFRNIILEKGKILEYRDFGNYMVFENASIQTMIYVVQNNSSGTKYDVDYSRLNLTKTSRSEVENFLRKRSSYGEYYTAEINRKDLKDQYIRFVNTSIEKTIERIEHSGKEYEFLVKEEIAQGVVAPQDFLNAKGAELIGKDVQKGDGVFVLTDKEFNALNLDENERSLVRPYYTSENLKRYYGERDNSLWIIYTSSEFKNRSSMKPYPKLKAHLDKYAAAITSCNKPYGLHRARNEDFFRGEKIVSLRKCVGEPCFTYTDFDCYVSQSYNVIKTDRFNAKALTAILNSKLIAFWLRNKGKMQGDNFQVDREPLLSIPLVQMTPKQESELEELAAQMIDCYRNMQKCNLSDNDLIVLNMRKAAIEKNINAKVYRLYGIENASDIEVIEQ